MKYPYRGGRLLQAPFHYMYSKYEGPALLAAYLAEREADAARFESLLRETLRSPQPPTDDLRGRYCALSICASRTEGTVGDLARTASRRWGLAEPTSPIELPVDPEQCDKPIPTLDALHRIAVMLLDGGDRPGKPSSAWVSYLVRRFEISKRLRREYPSAACALVEPWMSAEPYFLLSVCALMVRTSKGSALKFLNAALKLNDLGVSMARRNTFSEAAAGAAAIRLECVRVSALLDEQGVDVDANV